MAWFIRLCVATLLLCSFAANAAGGSVAFFYGATPPVNALSQFDRIIVESDNIKPAEHRLLKQHGAATFAYMSIGEVGPTRDWYNKIPAGATFGINTDWNSKVMNLASADWQRVVLQRVNELVSRGYDGIFLDTMDSYSCSLKHRHKKHSRNPVSPTCCTESKPNIHACD